jgi:hypothetical protein
VVRGEIGNFVVLIASRTRVLQQALALLAIGAVLSGSAVIAFRS